ncbi:signal peptidase I [Candidatus Uhrbacteria bacterium RIFCSPHIGHO2_02_FULL_53_13]|uniref:Signal peptidase I n=1 Tax=Candidatus Uhrbacteria bacterium RIFCSPHIGHO2_02_FULL_53_13 TaxID=1802389 RepID=A0A1F7U0M3_9BACT|nr:MAG: signal peptidase I [Candidatus Uhrbacteria bacterium RIFCSPHIGHO2_02_FULL_53_13]
MTALLIFTIEIVQIVVIAAAIIIPVRYFVVQPFVVRGASMEPTFTDREYLLVDEISYRFHEPIRGDVVVFRYPLDPSEFFIKRVVGVPGDTVDVRNGKIVVSNAKHPDGAVLDESYLGPAGHTGLDTHVVLNLDEYFLLGDNRGASLDSRNFGPVKEEFLVGKVWVRGWPLQRFGAFHPPEYNL